MMAAPHTADAFPDFMNVLVLIGLPFGPVNQALSRHVLNKAPDGVMVNVFDDLFRLPRYSEALEAAGPPDAVIALRAAAAEADALLIVTSYRGRIPPVAHSAIDWLTRRWSCGALHDKPLAVIGRSAGCYSGVWSRQVEDIRGDSGSRVIEPLAVPTLCEAVKMLADDVHGGSDPLCGTERPNAVKCVNSHRMVGDVVAPNDDTNG
jgi:hypothetical protein